MSEKMVYAHVGGSYNLPRCIGCGREQGYGHTLECPKVGSSPEPEFEVKHGHYYKACPYPAIDIYRVLELFNVSDPVLQHVAKKALVTGGRGHKGIEKDVQDMIDSLLRWQEMRREESGRDGK